MSEAEEAEEVEEGGEVGEVSGGRRESEIYDTFPAGGHAKIGIAFRRNDVKLGVVVGGKGGGGGSGGRGGG